MIIKRHLNLILMICLIIMLSVNTSFARGILGDDIGDRSSFDNTKWLKYGIEQLHQAIKSANAGDQSMSLKYGKESISALKEIASEGWAPKIGKSFKKLRHGISASKKGDLEKASVNYQLALKKVESLKFGDLNWTHDSFMGIGDHLGE